MQYLTVRNIPPDLATALSEEKHKRRLSLNQTVIELLRRSLGVGPGYQRSNGLRKLAGQWTDEEHRQFEDALRVNEEIDEELWR